MTTRVLMLFLASVVLYSCGSTIQTFEEALNSEIESTPIIPLAVDGIKDELDSDLLDNKFIVEYGSLENPLYNDKLDSIYEVLKNEKSILLDLADKQLYLDLLSRYNADTTYLTNIYMKTPKSGLPVTYVYNVKKNDLVFYTIENLGRNNIEEVSILEGNRAKLGVIESLFLMFSTSFNKLFFISLAEIESTSFLTETSGAFLFFGKINQ